MRVYVQNLLNGIMPDKDPIELERDEIDEDSIVVDSFNLKSMVHNYEYFDEGGGIKKSSEKYFDRKDFLHIAKKSMGRVKSGDDLEDIFLNWENKHSSYLIEAIEGGYVELI